MKFIIFICNRLRQGQFPRLSDFPYNEQLGKYIYGGQVMNQREFNEACVRIFDPNYRTNGFTFRPEALDLAAIPATPAVSVPTPAPTSEDLKPSSEDLTPSSEEKAPSSEVVEGVSTFAQHGDDIYLEGRIVGRLFDGKLKMVKGEAELREQALAFIASEKESLKTESLV